MGVGSLVCLQSCSKLWRSSYSSRSQTKGIHCAMNWGVFDKTENVHVALVDSEMRILKPHTLDEFCCCEPIIEQVDGYSELVVIHNEEN